MIKKLAKGKFLSPLEKNQLSWYVAFQKVRVPFFEKSSNQLSEKLDREKILKVLNNKTEFDKFINDQKKKYKGQKKIPTRKELIDTIKTNRISMKYPRAHSLRAMMFLAVPLSDLYTDSQWILLQAKDSVYITSDNPAVTISMAKNGKIPFSETTFTLAPQSCLMINQEQHGKTFITEEKASGVNEINRRTLLHATRFLFGNDETLLKQYYKEYLELKTLHNTIQSNIRKPQPPIPQQKLFIRRMYKH